MRLQICRSARAGCVTAIKAATETKVMLIRDIMRIAHDFYHGSAKLAREQGRNLMSIKLSQANRMIAAIIKRGIELDCRPISVVVVEAGCIVKAFQKEDGASMMRFEMALGKAYAALALSRSSKLVRVRNEEKPVFMRYLMAASGEKIFAEGGGMQIRDKNGEVIGAVGVTADTVDRDEQLAAHGIHAVGLSPPVHCKDMGRKFRQRLGSGADGR